MLCTPVGLRTFPMDDVHYNHHYGGDQWHRDSAYHEGTAWSWLLGAYVDAIMKTGARSMKQDAARVIRNFAYHLDEEYGLLDEAVIRHRKESMSTDPAL